MTSMRALTVEAPGKVTLGEAGVPEPGPDEVLVRVARAGICGSDVEILEGTRPSPYVRYPIIPGHEWCGRVAGVEAGVAGVEVGSLVVAEGFRACGHCARCREGLTNLCSAEYAETGFTHAGAFADYVAVPVSLVHVLPPDTDTGAAALLEPAACVACGLLEADLRPGLSVAVVGAGTLGLLAIAMLKLTSPARLAAVGGRPQRLELASALGATEHYARGEPVEGGFDLVFESAGRPEAAAQAVALARRGGTVVLEGISGSDAPALSLDAIALGHLHVQGIFGASRRAWLWVVDLLRRGALDVSSLVTHTYELDRYRDAFSTLQSGAPNAVKVQFDLGG